MYKRYSIETQNMSLIDGKQATVQKWIQTSTSSKLRMDMKKGIYKTAQHKPQMPKAFIINAKYIEQ